jgi:GNAT superfamily N-acetyltransferase
VASHLAAEALASDERETRRVEENWHLRGGIEVNVRSVESRDAPRLVRFFQDLSSQSRYLRFLSHLPGLSTEVLDGLIKADGQDHLGLVVLTRREGAIVADARLAKVTPGKAEFALVVADGWQAKGIGRRLLAKIIEVARSSGYATLQADYLSENRRMIGLMRDARFQFHRLPGDGPVGHACLDLNWDRVPDAIAMRTQAVTNSVLGRADQSGSTR